jgi:hypothetical protein
MTVTNMQPGAAKNARRLMHCPAVLLSNGFHPAMRAVQTSRTTQGKEGTCENQLL